MARIIRGIFNADFAKSKDKELQGEGAGSEIGSDKKPKKVRGVFNTEWKEKPPLVPPVRGENTPQVTGDPERSKSVNGVDTQKQESVYQPGPVKFNVTDEAMLGKYEDLKKLIDHVKTKPRLTKDITKNEELQVPEFSTPSDATKVDIGGSEGEVKVVGENTKNVVPNEITVPTREQGKGVGETVADVTTSFGNAFNGWVNTLYKNTVDPNKQGIPMNPFMDIPFSEQLTKYIPGYKSIRYKNMEGVPDWIKEAKLPTNNQFGDTPPQDATEFIGHLGAGLVPLIMASMLGIPPTVSFPLINEPGVQQQLKDKTISEGDANWERAGATFMGGLFELPVTKVLFKEIKDLPIKESTKMGLTKAGDVLFKTIGTAMIDGTTQMLQGKVPDWNEVAVNAGTIFVMELFGGHQKIRKMSEKFSEDRLIEFAKKLAKGEPVDAEIQADVEAVHNKPITDVRRLLLGKREHRFEVGEDGQVKDLSAEKPQEMLLTTMEKLYGMKPDEISTARENLRVKPKVEEPGMNLPSDQITDKSKMLPPKREAQFEVNAKGEITPIDYKNPEALLLSSKGMSPKEIETSQKKLGVKPKVEGEAPEKTISKLETSRLEETGVSSSEKVDLNKDPLGAEAPLPLGKGETVLSPGDKVKSRNYRNPEELLTVVDARKDNMLKVRDAKGNESLIAKTSAVQVEGSKLQAPRQTLEAKAKEVRKARGKKRTELEAEMLQQYDDYKQQYMNETGQEFNADKSSETGKVLEYLEAKKKLKENRGKFGLQASLLPTGFNPENLPEYVKIGKYHLENLKNTVKDKAVTYGDWAIKMVEEFSDYIRPHLRDIWRGMNDEAVEKSKVKSEKVESKDETASSQSSSQKIRPERINQQGDFESEFKPEEPGGKEKEARIRKETEGSPTMKRKEALNIVELREEYYKLKNERDNNWEPPSDKFREITLKMNKLKARIEGIQEVSTRGRKPDIEDATSLEKQSQRKEDLFKRVIRKLPEYESKANETGYRGEDAIEEVRKLIKRDLQTNEAWQRMPSEQKYGLTKQLDEQFKVLNKQRLQISADLDEPYAERRLRTFLKHTILQSLKVVEKMGDAGKEFSSRVKKYQERERELMGEPSTIVLDAGKLTKEEYKNLSSIRRSMMMEDGKRINPMNKNVSRVNDQIDAYYDKTAQLIRKRGFETTNPSTGEVTEFHPRKDYDPRVLEITLDKLGIQRSNGEPIFNQRRERQLEHMVESGQARTKSEAADMLDAYIQDKKVNVGKMGNVEYARVKDIEFAPEMYIQDPIRRLVNYSTKVSKRVAHEENFGMDGGIALRLLDRIKSEHYDEGFARDMYRYETGNLTPKERKAMSHVNFVKGFMAVTKFSPFTTLRNSLQGVLGSSIRGNLKSAMTGFVKSFSAEAKRNAYQSGALADSIESVVMKDFGGDSNFVSNYLKWIGFTGTDRFNRVVGATAGEVFYKDMLNRIKTDSALKKRALREFEKIGLDPEAVSKRGKFTEDELNLVRRTFAGDTQFNIRPSDLPLWWSSPSGKILTQWKPFSYKMTQMIRDNVIGEIKKGNPMPLITLIAAYGVGGEAVNTIIDLVRGFLNFNPRKEEKEKGILTRSAYMKIKQGDVEGLAYRLVEDYASLGALGMMVDMFRSMGYGKWGVVGAVGGPSVSTAAGIIESIFEPPAGKLSNPDSPDEWDDVGTKMARSLYRIVLTNVPFGSIPRTFGFTKYLEKQIWPPKTSETEKLYDELEEKGVDVKKLEELDKQRKEVKSLYDKAKETKSRADIDAYVKADEELEKRQDESEEYQKFSDLKWERNQNNAEMFGQGKYKIWNELKGKGLDTEKLREIERKEREVSDLKQKAERTKSRVDIKAFKDADYQLSKLKKGKEWYEFQKLKKTADEKKKKEREF